MSLQRRFKLWSPAYQSHNHVSYALSWCTTPQSCDIGVEVGRVYIDGFRWCILGGPPPFLEPAFLIGIGVTIFMLWLGIRQFRKMEKTFADLI